jgi:Ulp1 family protease
VASFWESLSYFSLIPISCFCSLCSGALVLFPDEAKDVSALHEVVASSISSFKVSTLELTSAEDADGYLSAFPAGAPPRHRPSSSAPRSEKDPDRVLFSYPWGRLTKDPIEVRKADMRRLAPGELLNDVMVDLFLRRLETNIDGTYAAGYSPRAVVLNSLFFTRLNTIPIPEGPPASVASAYKSMSRWTKDVKLFESDLVLVPIHEGLHWSLIAICHLRHLRFQSRSSKDPLHPRPLFLVLDSLRDQGLHDSSRIVEILKAFFAQECRQQSSYSEQPAAAAAVAALVQAKAVQPADLPQQANHVDCGSFVVHYAQDLYGAVRRSLRKGGPFSAAQWRPSRCSPEAMEAFRLDLLDECKAMELDYRLHAPI